MVGVSPPREFGRRRNAGSVVAILLQAAVGFGVEDTSTPFGRGAFVVVLSGRRPGTTAASARRPAPLFLKLLAQFVEPGLNLVEDTDGPTEHAAIAAPALVRGAASAAAAPAAALTLTPLVLGAGAARSVALAILGARLPSAGLASFVPLTNVVIVRCKTPLLVTVLRPRRTAALLRPA